MAYENVREPAEDEYVDCGTYTLSVATDDAFDLDAILQAAEFGHGSVRVTSAGDLRAAGFDVAPPKGKRLHANLILAQQRTVTQDDWQALASVFADPIPNPHKRKS
jgi:hypothetical protein